MPSKRTLLTVATCLATLNLYLPHVFAQQQTARVPMIVPDQVTSAVALDTHKRGGDHRDQALKWKSQPGSSYYFGQGEKLEANVIAVSGGGVEVLVGPKARIQIGQRMEVFRDGIHLGAVEITDIQTRRSTAVLDLSASSLGMGYPETIKVGDLLINGIPSVLKKTPGLSATGLTEVFENSGTAKPPMRTMHVKGTCVDENGTAVEGAEIFLFANTNASEAMRSTRSQPDGSFDLGIFPDAQMNSDSEVNYKVLGRKEGKAVGMAAVYGQGQTPANLRLVLGVAAQLQGTITGPDGAPVANAKVRLAGFPWVAGIHGTLSDRLGRYVLAPVANRDRSQFMLHSGTEPQNARFTDKRNHVLVVEHPGFGCIQPIHRAGPAISNVQFDQPAVISGRVVDERQNPIAGIEVLIRPSDQLQHRRNIIRSIKERGYSFATVRTDRLGRYSAPLQFEGAVRIDLNAPDHFTETVNTMARAGKVTSLDDLIASSPAFVAGRIVDVDSGKTVACPEDVRLRVCVMSSGALRGGMVGPDGTYRIAALPGVNYVYFSTSDFGELADHWEVLEHPSALTARNYPLRMIRGKTVTLDFPVRSTNGRGAATEPAAGHYTGACQVMRIGPNGDVSYDDTPLSISHLKITAGGKLKAMFPDRTLGRGKWHTLTLTKVSTTPRAVWSAVMDETTFKATAIPFSPRAYVFRLEVTERGRLISGAQQFYAVDLKGK